MIGILGGEYLSQKYKFYLKESQISICYFIFYMENEVIVLYNKNDCNARVPKVILEAVFVFYKAFCIKERTDHGKSSDDYNRF